MTTPRRDFLGLLGAGGLVAATGPIRLPEFDDGGDPYMKSGTWDLSWIKRVNGKARAVFDITTTENNGGWGRVTMWREQALEVYGKARNVSTVAVIRHAGIPLAMNDAYWAEHRLAAGGRGRGIAPDSAAAAGAPMRNPVASPKPGATDEQRAATIDGFLAAGGIVLACNLAFTRLVVPQIGRSTQLTGAALDAKAREYLIPGVILMPSGVFALIAAQQAGCGMCAALVPSATGAS